MLRSLKEVQADDSVVGFYQAMTLGSFFNQTLVDTQAIHQEKLRHGGIVIVHGMRSARAAGLRTYVVSSHLVRHVADCARERFIPGVPAYKSVLGRVQEKQFQHGEVRWDLSGQTLIAYVRATFSLISHRLTFSSILEEIPLKIRTNALLSAFLGTLTESVPLSGPDVNPSSATSSTTLPPSFATLNLGTSSVSRNLEHIIEALDNYKTEEGNLAYLQRQIAREKARADTYVSKRKEENAARVAQGLAPLPEEDVNRLFKIPPEPSRLESVLLLGKIDAYAKSLAETSSTGLVKMYAAKANPGV